MESQKLLAQYNTFTFHSLKFDQETLPLLA